MGSTHCLQNLFHTKCYHLWVKKELKMVILICFKTAKLHRQSNYWDMTVSIVCLQEQSSFVGFPQIGRDEKV